MRYQSHVSSVHVRKRLASYLSGLRRKKHCSGRFPLDTSQPAADHLIPPYNQAPMTITWVKTSHEAMRHAMERAPGLIIDAANCADPHALFPGITDEQLDKTYVLGVDLIYTFRDILKAAPDIARSYGFRAIGITRADILFHYSDDTENQAIKEHCLELLDELSKHHDIAVAEGRFWATP